MNATDLARQVAGMRALDDESAEALVAAAVVLLRTADDAGAWRLFAQALNRARPIATMATHPVWAELRPRLPRRVVARLNHPRRLQGSGPGPENPAEG